MKKCGKCKGEMKKGEFVTFGAQGAAKLSWSNNPKWGIKQRLGFGGKLVDLESYKCEKCGLVETYVKE